MKETLSLVENLALEKIHLHVSQILYHFSLGPPLGSEEDCLSLEEILYMEMESVSNENPCSNNSTSLEVSHT